MNEERKQLLESLLRAAIENIHLFTSYPTEQVLSNEEYQTLYLLHKNDSYSIGYRDKIKLVIKDDSVRNDLLDFMRHELAEYIYKDKIEWATVATIGGVSPARLDKLLEDILRIAIVFGVSHAVFVFQECLVEDRIDFQEIRLLSRIKIDDEIQVYDGVKLIPLPNSSGAVERMDILPRRILDMEKHSEYYMGRTLAIIDYITEPRFMRPRACPTMKRSSKRFQSYTKNSELRDFNFTEFLWNLSLCCNHLISDVMQCRRIDEWELGCYYSESGASLSYTFFNRAESSRSVSNCDITNAKKSYQKFKNLPLQVKEKLRIAIPRWLKSKSEGWVDRAIDLGIAFEVIYLDETKEQLSYTFRTRAAWYLGEDFSKRIEYESIFKEFYEYRSSAVHTGKISSAKNIQDRNKLKKIKASLDKADELCVASIVKIINDGGFPDWEALVLGG